MFNWLKKFFLRKKPEIIMIAAIQNDNGIGYQGNLIHSIKNDMKHFVDKTTNHTVIMGRKNWESISEKYRPFKNRQNIIITRDADYTADGALVVSSFEEAIAKSDREKIYIIGGGQIYTMALPHANTLDITQVYANEPADIFFPRFENDFKLVSSSGKIFDEKTNFDYEFQIWERK